ncbi:ABC transporter permease [Brenneria rubrifaciens]|uniref:ABC transporter permease n=1 Tax=Brenneria rubrifaciens TaxID=55213 RepID=A0A4P8QTY0_9GAMM|nr:ABC transporter permease [Brenneria rubrifaciens]QCR10116.1 ABC transporter permease [Brenneria rubrifaciens]
MNNLLRWLHSLRMVWAVFASFALGSLLILATGHNPFEAYAALFRGAFFDYYGLADTLIKMCPMLLTGLAVIIPMRCGLLNVGGEGQIYIGGLAAAAVALYLPALPTGLHLLLCLLAGMIGGGLWGAIPGYLRAARGINEVIVTLLMNYVGINIVSYFAGGPMMQEGAPYPYSNEISENLWLPIFLPNTDTHIGVIIAAVLSTIIFWVLRYTTVGFALAAVGKSPKAAQYAGMSIPRHVIGSMIAGGAIAGLAGAIEVIGVKYRLYHLFSPGYGYDGIVVAFMASLNPLLAMLSAFFLAGLSTGAQYMQRAIGLDVTAIEALRGLIVIFVAAGLIWKLRSQQQAVNDNNALPSTLSSRSQP